MAIRFGLFENNLASDPEDRIATVQATDSADLEAGVRRMIERGSTTTRADSWRSWRMPLGPASRCSWTSSGSTSAAWSSSSRRSRASSPVRLTSSTSPATYSTRGADPGSRIRKTVGDDATAVKDEAVESAASPI